MATLQKPYFTTKVVTIIADDKYQYFHHHQHAHHVTVVDNGACLRIEETPEKTVSYPLCNVERFETERKS